MSYPSRISFPAITLFKKLDGSAIGLRWAEITLCAFQAVILRQSTTILVMLPFYSQKCWRHRQTFKIGNSKLT